MVCSNCGAPGHNKRTCGKPSSQTIRATTRPPTISLEKPLRDFQDLLSKLETDRPEQYTFANDCVESLMNGAHVSIKAEEKTGKRAIMETIHTILNVNHTMGFMEQNPPRSLYVTALSRKDTKDQFKEQEEVYGITSVIATKYKDILDAIMKVLVEGCDSKVYIHLDECDYGSGDSQSLSKLYLDEDMKRHNDRVKFLTYSATPEEVLFSEKISQPKWVKKTFTPSTTYFGAQKYLDRNLVSHPEPFFIASCILSRQGLDLLGHVRENCLNSDIRIRQRNVVVVRVTGRGDLDILRSEIEALSERHGCEIHIFDQTNAFDWGVDTAWFPLGRTEIKDPDGNIVLTDFKPTLLIINQICSRSTELHPTGHRRLYAWHDSRMLSDKYAYNTLSQAIGRVKHYTQSGFEDNCIRLYVDQDILNITLGNPTSHGKIKMAQRVVTDVAPTYTYKVTYEDEFTDLSSVKDWDWQDGDPNGEGRLTTYIEINGKWCLKRDKPRQRFFSGDTLTSSPIDFYTTWGDDNAFHETLLYESADSERYLIRRVNLQKQLAVGTETTFKTHTKSMYSH